jgi:NAD(P) transhydrogenase subunit alpha
MIVGIPKESFPGERRVAIVPEVIPSLTQAGMEVRLEAGAGEGAGYLDGDFERAGGKIVAPRPKLFSSADVILQVLALNANPAAGLVDLEWMRPNQALIAFLRPLAPNRNVLKLAEARITAFAIELLPRITRAQPMDALSSMSTVAGYKSVIVAADALPKLFPMLMTAAGTIRPARVFVIGAGVLGLQALATARRLGAVAKAYDVRPAVKQEVESLGARFVELPLETGESDREGGYAQAKEESFYRRQRELLASVLADSDVVITAAVVPGRDAPVLITEEMVEKMPPGAVIVDLAGERGGNCSLSVPGESVVHHGVTILSPINIASTVAVDASRMYAKNMSAFLRHVIRDGRLRLDAGDEIVRETLVTHDGEVVNRRVREYLGLPPLSRA